MSKNMRIDKFLAARFGSRTKAAAAVEKGLVLVNGKAVDAAYDVNESHILTFLQAEESFVSAGGYKLAKALKDFDVSVAGKVFADIGASNGGFTDCLLQNGAAKVYCIDVGANQLDESLKAKNIVVIDNFNARALHGGLFAEELDGIVIDVSFISLTYILGAAADVLGEGKEVYALIKPQFECSGRTAAKNGIVKDEKIHQKVIKKVYDFAKTVDLAPQALTNAPVVKGKNMEYIMRFVKGGSCIECEKMLKSVIL